MRDVAVIGVGMTKWGELWDKSLRTIFVETALLAIEDAGVEKIDSMYVGCMSSGLFTGQEHLGSLLSDYLGRKPVPATRIESACCSGGLALRQGFIEVAAGVSDVVLVGGIEKMTDVGGNEATYALGTAADQEYEGFHGLTFPGLYAMMAVDHMHRHGTTREQLAMVAVKNHENGSRNPLAQFPFKVTVDAVLKSVLVADPLRILDCSPITDGRPRSSFVRPTWPASSKSPSSASRAAARPPTPSPSARARTFRGWNPPAWPPRPPSPRPSARSRTWTCSRSTTASRSPRS
jgi:acetyl-CoA C-acetyltransferase